MTTEPTGDSISEADTVRVKIRAMLVQPAGEDHASEPGTAQPAETANDDVHGHSDWGVPWWFDSGLHKSITQAIPYVGRGMIPHAASPIPPAAGGGSGGSFGETTAMK
jgi:hypothetical protein